MEAEIPFEFVDQISMDFAYDPVTLSHDDDPNQQWIFNRRTLEKIWETTQSAKNPYTRQPFDLQKAIPHVQLRCKMRDFIQKNRELALGNGWCVIPDYARPLLEDALQNLLKRMNSYFVHIWDNLKEGKGEKPQESHVNSIWQDLNLLRLHLQYQTYHIISDSVRSNIYKLLSVTTAIVHVHQRLYGFGDALYDMCREIAKILEITDILKTSFSQVPRIPDIICVLYLFRCLAYSGYSKNRSMSLRILRKLMENILETNKGICILDVCGVFKILGTSTNNRELSNADLENAENAMSKELSNADLWNAMSILQIINTEFYRMPEELSPVEILADAIKLILMRIRDNVVDDPADKENNKDGSMLGESLFNALYVIKKSLLVHNSFSHKCSTHDCAAKYNLGVRRRLAKLLSIEFLETVLEITEMASSIHPLVCKKHVEEANIIATILEMQF